MIAVVTGASGFIGRNLVGRLLDEGHVVRCLVRPHGSEAPKGTERTVVDIRDAAALRRCGALVGADVVYHLGGATRARSASAFRDANVIPTQALLHALDALRAGARFVYVSSQAAAGPASAVDEPLRDGDPSQPVEDYGRSKLEGERVVQRFADRLPVAILRPCSVFGPFDRDFLALFRMASRGIVVYPGVEDHWLSLLHVGDVVDALLAAGSRSATPEPYFLAPREPIQWRELGAEIGKALGRTIRHLQVPGPVVRAAARVGDLLGPFLLETPLLNSNKAALSQHPYWVCTAERARKDLGWSASRSLPDAVRDTYLWYRQSGWLSA